ncbi:DUF2325 domain-containing protein [Rhizobium sp. P44RR-XXIV]|uniref:DUF2325 domain-containing protein n=1 Tax=Rhizobium sp. P44RR-XXIV TaxID=1921145 RepID=UPI0009874C11|nr:DUF2325 domain-containing protein [Rhizobium sp. P44RR-XXIV]TIX86691.1 DUF2325 domain-containing protein [Rhizobium sp. P44RR-XXIV]
MSVLLNHKQPLPLALPNAAKRLDQQPAPDQAVAAKSQRLKTWDLAPMFHCSIVGTCLTTSELRQVLAKVGDIDAKVATDHALHSRGVRAAGQRDISGKLLNKALDRRHERILKQFSRLSSPSEIKAQWNKAVDEGDISGAYWAVLSHPASERALVNEVFGEVHMLSHLVGSSSRLDLARLRKLQLDIEARDEKIARQETRLQTAATDHALLQKRVDELEVSLLRKKAMTGEPAPMGADQRQEARLLQRLQAADQRADEYDDRLAALEAKLAEADRRAVALAEENKALRRELELLESVVTMPDASGAIHSNEPQALLYVGGRPNLFDRLRKLAESRNIDLVLHDGGVEDNLSLLPAMVGRVSWAIFPVDCISHSAADMVKRLCRENEKPYLPLRSASLASFAAAIAQPLAVAE